MSVIKSILYTYILNQSEQWANHRDHKEIWHFQH